MKKKKSIKYPLLSLWSQNIWIQRTATPPRWLEQEGSGCRRPTFRSHCQGLANPSYLSNVKHEKFLWKNQHFKEARQYRNGILLPREHGVGKEAPSKNKEINKKSFLKGNLLSNSLPRGIQCKVFKRTKINMCCLNTQTSPLLSPKICRLIFLTVSSQFFPLPLSGGACLFHQV